MTLTARNRRSCAAMCLICILVVRCVLSNATSANSLAPHAVRSLISTDQVMATSELVLVVLGPWLREPTNVSSAGSL